MDAPLGGSELKTSLRIAQPAPARATIHRGTNPAINITGNM